MDHSSYFTANTRPSIFRIGMTSAYYPLKVYIRKTIHFFFVLFFFFAVVKIDIFDVSRSPCSLRCAKMIEFRSPTITHRLDNSNTMRLLRSAIDSSSPTVNPFSAGGTRAHRPPVRSAFDRSHSTGRPTARRRDKRVRVPERNLVIKRRYVYYNIL